MGLSMEIVQIGLLGQPSRKRFQIANRLQNETQYLIRIFSSISEMRKSLDAGLLSGLILLEDKFQDEHVELMDELAFNYDNLSVLCMVVQISQGQRAELQRYNIKRCTVLDSNHELKDLAGVIERMTKGDQVSLRSHYRFSVSKRAFAVTEKGSTQRIQIVDLSHGGLQAKTSHLVFIAGQKIQIRVPLGDGRGHHLIFGRIAWVDKKGFLGVQFEQVVSQVEPSKFYGWAS